MKLPPSKSEAGQRVRTLEALLSPRSLWGTSLAVIVLSIAYGASRVQERRARSEVDGAGIADALLPDSVAQVFLPVGEDANRSFRFYTNVLGAIPLEQVSNCTGVYLGSVDIFFCPTWPPPAPQATVP